MNITPQKLRNLTHSVVSAFGCSRHEADIVSDHLVGANLAGHDSHGVGVLPMYGLQVKDGNLVPNQTPEFGEATGAITLVDAKRGFGHRMVPLALDHAMKTIPEHKVAILGLRNSGHISRTGTYSEYCAERGYVSIHFVNVVGHSPLVAPFGSRETGFSTNPISIAMPVDGKASPMLDMATSTVAFNKVRVANNKGEPVPEGCVLDARGFNTTDPQPMAEQRIGALTAFGAHKGSGLAIFAELLAGALSSDSTVASAEHIPNGAINCLFSVIVDPAAFDDPAAIAKRTMDFCHSISECAPAEGVERVLLPGEPEHLSRAERSADGIPVDPETLQQIIATGVDFGLDAQQLHAMVS